MDTRGYGDGNIVHWKVGHPTVSNDIVPMASFGAQPRFYFGGSQVPFYLGIKGNSSGNGSNKSGSHSKKRRNVKL
jgi:hypothetical protein